MDKNQSIPLSIERFAAYLDHNLPDGEMQAIDNVVNKDESLSQLVCLSKEADTVIAEWQPEDTPFDANSLDFELPKIESFNSSDNEWSFAAFGGVDFLHAVKGELPIVYAGRRLDNDRIRKAQLGSRQLSAFSKYATCRMYG